MTSDRVRELLTAQPFRGFQIGLSDGREIPIRHPEYVALAPGGRTAVVFQQDDSMNIIDLLLVTDLEATSNGSRRS